MGCWQGRQDCPVREVALSLSEGIIWRKAGKGALKRPIEKESSYKIVSSKNLDVALALGGEIAYTNSWLFTVVDGATNIYDGEDRTVDEFA